MGRRNKKYSIDLHQQAYNRLTEMLHNGEGTSKKEAVKAEDTADKIFSYNTYKTYWKHAKYFTKWIKANYPECTTLKASKKHVNEWLQSRVDQGLSAWTIQTEMAALCKLYGIQPDDPNRFQPPKRNREDIKRSRTNAERDKHFSVTNNDELIKFCQGTGLRRAGLMKITGKSLWTKEQVEEEINRINEIPEEKRTAEDRTMLNIAKDTRIFTNPDQKYFIYTVEKGGRARFAPVIGPNTDQIVARFKATAPDEHVWLHVSSNADIHGYRGQYATAMYRMYARPIERIPYDKTRKGTGMRYQSEVYICRKDEKGKRLDKHAMLVCSKALGHNRIEIVANNYIRGL